MIRVIISGGGTGGHIFPAIAIANALKKSLPDIDILFIGAQGKMEMEKVPAAGYLIEGLWISGLQRSMTVKNLLFPFKVFSSMIKASRIINRFKPDVVIGVGGYASGPTLRTAARKKIPTLIQEQNSYPGITNKLLAGKVSRICVAYEGMERFFPKEKIVLTGNPIRQDIILTREKRTEAMDYFQLSGGKKTVLVIGGSLGAGTINKSVKKCISRNITEKNIQILWQTGKFYYGPILNDDAVKSAGHVKIMSFIDRMDLAYAAADIIVSRAGAIAISELCVAGKPAILIPSPNVAEDHQTKNAEALVRKNAAIMIRDAEAEENLYGVLIDLIGNDARQEMLKTNIYYLAVSDAAEKIAGEALKLVKSKS